MKTYLLGACAIAFLGGLITGKSAFGATAEAGLLHSAQSEQQCLADNIYWEARNQTGKGMIGVAFVTLNRVNDNRFPHSYCEVIKQGPERPSWKNKDNMVPLRHRCQFSWYCDGKSDNVPTADNDIYEFARSIAFKVYHGHLTDFTNGATHYHADYVKPAWASSKTKTLKIDQHIFYRWEK
jgi:N-acetylmuramoyl-L-alanine amidase